MFVLMLASCTPVRYITQTSVQRDSIYITQLQKDSIYMHDSIATVLKADTLVIERWHTKYIERLITDTMSVIKTDTMRIPYPVEKPLSWSEKMLIKTGKWASTAIGLALIILVSYILIKRFSS